MDVIYFAHVLSTRNNTHVTIVSSTGRKVCGFSAGVAGFKGAQRSSGFAGQRVGFLVGKLALSRGVSLVGVFFKGFGRGRFSVSKGFLAAGLKVALFKSLDNPPFNGCRPKKIRRLLF
jgi:small subunit ribosomal protein S11